MDSFNSKQSSQITTETSDQLRNKLLSRNLYSIDNEYTPGGVDINKILGSSLNNIISVIEPLQSIKLLVDNVGDRLIKPSPLVVIGMQQLAKQLAYTVASNSASNYLPKFEPLNIFQKGKPIFSLPLHYNITNRKRTAVGDVIKVLETVTGFYDTKNPFTSESTLLDFIENTSDGQLGLLLSNLNRNVKVDNEYKLKQLKFPESSGILIGYNSLIRTKKFIGFGSNKLNNIISNDSLLNISNLSIGNELVKLYDSTTEYDLNNEDFLKSFGDSKKNNTITYDDNNPFNSDDYGNDDNISNQFILGRDGKSEQATVYNDKFGIRGENLAKINPDTNISGNFNIRQGLLKYTTELLNASEGKLLDQTRKKFYDTIDTTKFIGYNGGGLYIPNDDSMFAGKTGIRQHTVVDQYNRYAKAIRFEGNKFYDGNPNSVIYNTVLPKIHPVIKNGKMNNKNMMFSIENLAYRLRKDEDEGFAIDENNTYLPISECGQDNGRIMWFPPYNLKYNETSTANWETTKFIGRSEPIYSYSNSERSAVLSFSLLIDTPPQLAEYRNDKKFQQRASEFFAFGGRGNKPIDNGLGELKPRKEDIIKSLSDIQPKPVIEQPIDIDSYQYYFENNVPYGDDNFNIYSSDYEYNVDNHLNDDFKTSFNLIFENKQITNDNIGDLVIEIIGSATKLYDGTISNYNFKLSEYRCNSMKNYIISLCTANGINIDVSNNFIIKPIGSEKSSDTNKDVSTINTLSAKEERYTQINFNYIPKKKTPKISAEDEKIKQDLLLELDKVNGDICELEKSLSTIKPFNFREIKLDNDRFIKGFQGVKENIFQPSFFSQTPEDFHRRLTFLQQCLRQGKSINTGVGNNSVFGRQPFCILRLGDFIFTKIIIEQITFDYNTSDSIKWDLNPEGRGMQPMIADISMNIKIIGGESMSGPISVLQNALAFNYYANSTFTNNDTYSTPYNVEILQYTGTTKS